MGFAPCFVERLCLAGRILRNIMVLRGVNPPVARPVHRRTDGFTRRKTGLMKSGASERRSLSASRAAEPQVAARES